MLLEVDLFFTSCDEARLIENTLSPGRIWSEFSEDENNMHSLEFLTDRFWRDDDRAKLFGVTVSDGAYEKHILPNGTSGGPSRTRSRFMDGEVIDLVGAGDSFSAAMIVGMLRNQEFSVLWEQANRLASFVCSQKGAMPEIPEALKAEMMSSG